MNGLIIDGNVYKATKGECNKRCAFWNDKQLCENILWYCAEKSCYFILSKRLTQIIKCDNE